MDRCQFGNRCDSDGAWLVVVPGDQKRSCYYHLGHIVDLMLTGSATVVKIKTEE